MSTIIKTETPDGVRYTFAPVAGALGAGRFELQLEARLHYLPLVLDGEVVGSVQKIVAGKPGTPVLGSRIRKCVKGLVEGAFPKMKLVAKGEIPGQQELLPTAGQ